MYISRFVSLLSKPVLSQCSLRVASVLWAPCRTIKSCKDYVRFGSTGSKMPEGETRSLDDFLGTWISDPERAQEYAHYMSAKDIAKLEKQKGKRRRFQSFERDNEEWTTSIGIDGLGNIMIINFTLNIPFVKLYPDNTLVKMCVVQMADDLVWSFSSLEKIGQLHCSVMKVRQDKLFISTAYPDGNVSLRIYFKV